MNTDNKMNTIKATNKPKVKLIVVDRLKHDLNVLLEPYKTSEFLPIVVINELLTTAFKSCQILHEYTSQYKIIKIKVDDLLSANITNWQYNRPPDLTRCNDIARYIYNSMKPIDTMLYLSFNNAKQSFDIIDGIHRYTSLKIIKEHNTTPLDLLTPSEFGNNNDAAWLYESYLIVNVRINSTDGELIELFKSLNKSNPIPDLYIRDTNKDKKDAIEKVANNWQIKYKSHFSPNSKPYKPNINRDRFIDLLDSIYDKYNLGENPKYCLEKLLERTNTDISYNIPRKTTQTIREKCADTNCWLFIYGIDELKKMI